MKRGMFILSLAALLGTCLTAEADPKPNVILITIDDLNDWIGPLGGNTNALTPEIDSFCSGGAVVFRNAVCAAPICGPSRSAFLSGYMPHRSGVYNNSTNMRDSELVQSNPTLPEYFRYHGYYTLSTGKIFHGHSSINGADKGHWAFDTYFDNALWDTGDSSLLTESKNNKIDGVVQSQPYLYDGSTTKGLTWGPTVDPDLEGTKDHIKATWAKNQLEGTLQEPFFMAVGLYKPHYPWIVPQQFFDLYDLAEIDAPYVNVNDLDDITKANGSNLFKPMKDYEWVTAYGLEKEAARGYMAAVSEADACLGVILDALANSSHASNTIVIVSGDHGWHLGEKLRYHKNTLWAEAVLTPLMVRTPGMTTQQYCDNPVSLVDLYPTLIDLCGLEAKTDLDGVSFSSMLQNPSVETNTAAVTINANGASVLSKRWHYIEDRAKGPDALLAREFYDRLADPYEKTNLIDSTDPEHVAAIAALSAHAPQQFAASVYVDHGSGPSTLDSTIKPTRLNLDYDTDGYSALYELFWGTHPAIQIGRDPASALVPHIFKTPANQEAYRYGMPTGVFTSAFTHNLWTSGNLSTWTPATATPSATDPSIYELEFPPTDTRNFVKLKVEPL